METDNYTAFEEEVSSEFTYFVAHEVVFVLFCVVSICLDVTGARVLLRRKDLRSPADVLLANWMIADVLSILVTPSAWNIVSIAEHIVTSAASPQYHVAEFLKLGLVLHSIVILFATVVALDWFFAAYFPTFSERIRSWVGCTVGAVWGLGALFAVLTFTGCTSSFDCTISGPELLISFLVLVCVTVSVQLIRGVQRCRGRPCPCPGLALHLTTVFVVVWGTGFANLVFWDLARTHPLLSTVLDCVLFSSATVNFALLCKFRDGFWGRVREALGLSRDEACAGPLHFKNPIVTRRNDGQVLPR